MWSADLVRHCCRPRSLEWTACHGLAARSLSWRRSIGTVEHSSAGHTRYAQLSRRQSSSRALAATRAVSSAVPPVPALPADDDDDDEWLGDGDDIVVDADAADERVPRLRFDDGEQYAAYFAPAVHALINGSRDADVRVPAPRFHRAAGLQLCSVADGLRVARAMFPSQYNVADALVGETVFLVANADDGGKDSPSSPPGEPLCSYSCRILMMPSVPVGGDAGGGGGGGGGGDDDVILLQVEEPFVDDVIAASAGGGGVSFTLMQHSQEPVAHVRMLDTLHDFGVLAKRLAKAEAATRKTKNSNATTTAASGGVETTERVQRPPKLSAHLFNAILCRPPPTQAQAPERHASAEHGNDNDSMATPPPSPTAAEAQNPGNGGFPAVRIPERVAESLNERQVEIVAKVFTQALTLIRGPPGSGKTTVAAAIVLTALEAFRRDDDGGVVGVGDARNSKILVCASSNVAADNLCDKICQWGVRAVRINARTSELERRVPPALKPYCLEDLVLQLAADKTLVSLLRRYYGEERLTVDELEQLGGLRSHLEHRVLRDLCDVIVTTCATAGDARLDRFACPLVLVDEVTQSYEPETLIPLMSHARHAVLIGDPCQLGPVPVACAEHGHRLRSMYDRLILAGTPTEFLHTQFRMHPALAAFSSRVFYGGELRSGVSAGDRTPPGAPPFPWPAGPGAPIAFWHDASPHRAVRHSCANDAQAAKVLAAVGALRARGADDVGVITPYSAQRALIKEIVSDGDDGDADLLGNLEVCSVDEFQGREKDYIVVSCVRSSSSSSEGGSASGTIGFLDDPRRLNVMLTRAKLGVILVGDAHLLATNAMWCDLLCDLQEQHCLVTGDNVATLVQLNTAPFKRHGFVFELGL